MRTMFERFSLAGVMRDGEGGAAPPAPAPATPSPAPAVPPAAPVAPAGFDFSQHGVAGDDLLYVQNKGWKGPNDLVASYRNLEKLHGVPADQIVRLPGADAKPEDWGQVFTRLGKPAAPDGYQFQLPQGDDGVFAKTAAGWMHEANLTQAQAAKLFEKVTAWAGEQAQGGQASKATDASAQAASLLKEWGPNHDTNMAVAQRGAKAFGIDEGTIDKLQDALGYDGVMKFMHQLGSKVGNDAGFVAGDGKGGFEGNVTQEQAVAEIKRLRQDKTFAGRFNSSDPQVRHIARTEMRRLEQIAYPGTQVV